MHRGLSSRDRFVIIVVLSWEVQTKLLEALASIQHV